MKRFNCPIETAIITNGFRQPGFVEREEGLHCAVLFEFEPMLPEEVDALDFKCSQLSPEAARVASAERLAKAITKWDIKTETGESAVINVNSVRRLRPGVFIKMFNIVRGMRPTDIHPDWLIGAKDEKSTAQLTAPGAVDVVGADLKNS